ncbi:hypothetical protein EV363DRAFT_683452 [Boletus edulis]|nr:hypothetical protein EV363DRAFT_683452 [Boletus edulis]
MVLAEKCHKYPVAASQFLGCTPNPMTSGTNPGVFKRAKKKGYKTTLNSILAVGYMACVTTVGAYCPFLPSSHIFLPQQSKCSFKTLFGSNRQCRRHWQWRLAPLSGRLQLLNSAGNLECFVPTLCGGELLILLSRQVLSPKAVPSRMRMLTRFPGFDCSLIDDVCRLMLSSNCIKRPHT